MALAARSAAYAVLGTAAASTDRIAFLVPPFCEAHNHNLGSADGNQEAIDRYLNSRSVDAIFLNGG